MSSYRVLYDTVFDRLKECQVIKTVGDYNGQYLEDEIENYNLVKYPAVYLESSSVEWNKNINSILDFETEPQTGLAQIKVHIVGHSLKGFTKEVKDDLFALQDLVVAYIQRLEHGNDENGTFTTLLRVKEEYTSINDNLRSVVVTFETQLTDTFVTDETLYVEETIDITPLYIVDIN